jgi:hypothetical protein
LLDLGRDLDLVIGRDVGLDLGHCLPRPRVTSSSSQHSAFRMSVRVWRKLVPAFFACVAECC